MMATFLKLAILGASRSSLRSTLSRRTIPSPSPSLWKSPNSTRRSVVKKPVLIVAMSLSRKEVKSYIVTVSSSSGGGRRSHNNKRSKRADRAPRLNPIWKSWSLDRSTFALIGSTLYSVGGDEIIKCPSSLAYAADLDLDLDLGGCPNPPSKQWNEIADMHCERIYAKEVVIDEKLYVFGGIYPLQSECGGAGGTQPSPWAEVYCPKQKLWTALSEPPSYLSHIAMFASFDYSSSSKDKIVLGGDCPLLKAWVLLAYDVITDTWETISADNDDILIFPTVTPPVLYDNRLYSIADGVFVYDLHLKQMFSGPIKGYFDQNLLQCPFDMLYNPAFFHIVGDEFGVIWLAGDECATNFMDQKICCTTIRISTTIDEKGSIDSVKGRSLFTRCYPIHQHVYSLDGLLLDETSLTTINDAGEKKLKESSSGEISFAVAFGHGGDVSKMAMSLQD